MAVALDYTKWENFLKVFGRAMIACENSGHSVVGDFPEVRKIVEVGQKILDYMCSTELIFILMMLCVGNENVSPLVTQLSWTNQLLIMSGCKSNDGIAISVATTG